MKWNKNLAFIAIPLFFGALFFIIGFMQKVNSTIIKSPSDSQSEVPQQNLIQTKTGSKPVGTGTVEITASKAKVLALFGLSEAIKPTGTITLAPVEVKVPEKVGWMRYLGTTIKNDETLFIFKDDRNGLISNLSSVTGENGWRLLSVKNNVYILENGGKQYECK